MMLPNISDFIKNYVTKRENSFFENDLINNKEKLTKEIKGKSILVIGGAGTIGSSYIKAALRYYPYKLIVVDTVKTETSCTNKPYKYESIRGRLVLDTLDKDFIAFAIHPPNNLCIQCMTDRSNEVNGCNILTKPVFNGTAINLTNFRLRSSIYQEVILLKSSLANPIMDSVVVAKNFGIVGFKYNGESYMIQ